MVSLLVLGAVTGAGFKFIVLHVKRKAREITEGPIFGEFYISYLKKGAEQPVAPAI